MDLYYRLDIGTYLLVAIGVYFGCTRGMFDFRAGRGPRVHTKLLDLLALSPACLVAVYSWSLVAEHTGELGGFCGIRWGLYQIQSHLPWRAAGALAFSVLMWLCGARLKAVLSAGAIVCASWGGAVVLSRSLSYYVYRT